MPPFGTKTSFWCLENDRIFHPSFTIEISRAAPKIFLTLFYHENQPRSAEKILGPFVTARFLINPPLEMKIFGWEPTKGGEVYLELG